MSRKSGFRFKLAFIHFAISACSIAVISFFFLHYWYASPAWYLSGADHLFLMLLVVDVILGPCCTMLVANPKKQNRELQRDLMIIVAVQVAALSWGVHSFWQGRPVYMVYSVDRFELIQRNQLDDAFESPLLPRERSSFLLPLTWVWAKPPQDPKELQDILFSAALFGNDISVMPQHYRPLQDAVPITLKRMASISDLRTTLSEKGIPFRRSFDPDSAGALPMTGRERNAIAILDKKTLGLIDYVRIDPFSLDIWPAKTSTPKDVQDIHEPGEHSE